MIDKRNNGYCKYCIKQYLNTCPHDDYCGGYDFLPIADIYPNTKVGSVEKWNHSWKFTRNLCKLRDKNKCYRCKCDLKKGFETHHIRRRMFAGSNHPSNLLTLCSKCHNATKADFKDRILMKEINKKKYVKYWNKQNVGVK